MGICCKSYGLKQKKCLLILFISRKHDKIEYTFFPLLLWQLLS
jgi:hypothetical protein